LRADKIIAVSENTKKDIIRIYNVPEDKIKVIYHGNSLQPTEEKPEDLPELPKRYILFVGARGFYKNFIFFIKSISTLLKDDVNLTVVVAGGYSKENKFSEDEIILFKNLGINKQVFQYSVDDKMLAYLYKNAICFAFPTLYEGFGIPILEAFACSCPAVISNTSSLPEVGGDAVVYFDPTNTSSILKAIETVLNDAKLRNILILKGKEQLKKFSWEKTATETLELYSSLLRHNY
jgi:glycosyltransferase involved in cell wall biosynthesis